MHEPTEPPCRVCGSSRDAHGTMWNHDHRYRGERYCAWSPNGTMCGKPANWYVNGTALCSAHKGRAVREASDAGEEWQLRLDKIDRSR